MYDEKLSLDFGGGVEDDCAPIWRYVGLPALLHILQTRTLFFPSIATLAKIDPWEGRWSSDEAAVIHSAVKDSMLRQVADGSQDPGWIETTNFPDTFHQLVAKSVCVNCWHANAEESAAMWAIYGANHGIALQSSVGALKRALSAEERPVPISPVQYGSTLTPAVAPIRVALRKRNSFSHEREVRAIVVTEISNAPGTPVAVDVNTLINRIYLWPLAPTWIQEVVKSEIQFARVGNASRNVLALRPGLKYA
jgi:hypothetical protein